MDIPEPIEPSKSEAHIQQNTNGDQNQIIGQAVSSTIFNVAGGGQITFYLSQLESSVQLERPPTPSKLGANPYQGLSAFQETDGDRFFGREEQIGQLWQKLRTLYEAESSNRFLPVYGPSGSGKSSLVRAGLIPALARQPLPGHNRAKVAVLVPRSHPLEALALILARVATNDKSPAAKTREFAGELAQTNSAGVYNGLRRIADVLPEIEASPLLVLVDQFEEVYTLCEDAAERNIFIETLLDAARDRARRVSVIITLRSDFLGETQKHPVLNTLFAEPGFFVRSMNEGELRDAIAEPAKQAGYSLEMATIDLLIKDTKGREGALPLLQSALTRIWEGLVEGKEPAATLREIGGVGGALAEQAQSIYDGLNPTEKTIARRVFLELVQVGGLVKYTRRRVAVDNLVSPLNNVEQVKQVIKKFANPLVRLITLSTPPERETAEITHEAERETAEITHEALLEHWQTLKGWLENNDLFLVWRDHLRVRIYQWKMNGQDPKALLQGNLLAEAGKQLQEREADLSPIEHEFIQVSQKQQKNLEKVKKRALLRSRALLGIATSVILGSGIVALFKARDTQTFQRGARVEQAAVGALRQFKFDELNALIAAMHSAGELQELIHNIHNPNDYPATSPILSLQKILDDIHEQNHFEARQGELKSAVFLPGGHSFITAGKGKDQANTLQIWNLAGKLEVSLVGHEGGTLGGVNAVSVGGDTQNPLIASAGEDGTVRLWDQSGKQMRQLVSEGKKNESFGAIAVSPDGQKIIAGQRNGTVYLWERSGKQLKTWVAQENDVTAIAFSRDGQKVATAGEDGLARIWTVAGSKLAELKPVGVKKMYGVSFSPDGQSIAIACDDNRARIWKIAGQDVRLLEGHQGLVTVANFSPDGQTIATASDDGSVKLWDARTGQKLQDFRGHRGVVWIASFSPDGKWLVSAGRDEAVRLWNLGEKPVQQVDLAGFQKDVNAIAYSPDGKSIAGAGNEGVMRLWDTSGKEIKVWQEAIYQKNNVQDVAFSPDGTLIVASGLFSIARVWDVAGSAAEPQAKLKGVEGKQEGHQGNIGSVAVSPDSQLIATGSFDRTIRIWKPTSPNGALVAVTPEQEGVISRVVFTADGQRIVSADWEGNVAFWDLAGHQLSKWQRVHQTQIRGLGITHDGSRIVTADKSGVVKILDASGRVQREFFSYQSGINVLAISPDGHLIATGGMDGTGRLWDFQGRQLAEFQNPKGAIWGIAFSPDSHQLALAGFAGFARIRKIPSPLLMNLFKQGCSWLQDYLESHPTEKATLRVCQNS